MKITLWGTRGSLPTPGKSTERYGGNTACVEVRGKDNTLLVLDAGSGIRDLGCTIEPDIKRIDLLFTHLHMDHIQGLGFFAPLYNPNLDVHIWGPPSTTMDLRSRISLYLSPPLFPIRIRDLDCKLTFHNVPLGDFEIGPFQIKAGLICHPGPTLGFRVTEDGGSFTFMPDHEPAIGCRSFPDLPQWTSGFELAKDVDILMHDAQYTEEEYKNHVGWGHSSLPQALAYAKAANVKRLIAFHHDPSHDDKTIDQMIANEQKKGFPFNIEGAIEGTSYTI